MDDDILRRISRIYAAVGAIEERDPNKLRARLVQTNKLKSMFQDFRAGFNDDYLLNCVYMVTHNITNLRDHLKRWAAQNGYDKTKVDKAFKNSLALKIIKDLSNNDKHGYPPRRSYSGKSPKLVNINRVMELRTQAKKGSTIGMTLGAGGVPRFFGDGTAMAITTGDVVDNDNSHIGDLHKIATSGVEA